MPEEPRPARADPPSSRKRTRDNAFIAAFLAFQVITPLTYYLGGRGSDERFSYRMFSSVRLRDCAVQVTETPRAPPGSAPRRVAIERDVQIAWVRLLERNRTGVVEHYLRRRCARGSVSEVQYSRSCKAPDGTQLPPQRKTLRCNPTGTEAP